MENEIKWEVVEELSDEDGKPNYEDIEWYDEFGVKSSNVDYNYDPNDYEFYKVTYEVIDCNDEDNDMIESYEDYEYVYTDKYVEFDASRFKEDIDEMANEIRDVRSLDDGEIIMGIHILTMCMKLKRQLKLKV